MKKLIFLLGISLSCTVIATAQGAKGAFDFGAAAAANNHLDLGALPIGTSDFTIEFWYRAGGVNGDPSIFSNKDWNSGNNTGINIAIQGNGTNLDINFKGSTGPRKDLNVTGIDFTQGWNHIAVTVQRTGNLTCYVNGIQEGTVDISGSTGDITSAYTYKFGQDGTGNYSDQIEGEADELRIWNTARTASDIQTLMCQLLSAAPSNLLAGYNFDDSPGNSAADITGNYNATVIDGTAANWITSGAFLGNTSVYHYTANWSGVSLTLSGSGGDATVGTINGSPEGVHLYRNDLPPANQNGISDLLGNTTYYGVFMARNAATSDCALDYDYAGFSNAVSNESDLLLYGRTGNDAPVWTDYSAVVNAPANTFAAALTGNNEFMAGFFSGTCEAPANVTVSAITSQEATVNWICPSGNTWQIEYGNNGFTLGTGTEVSSSTPAFTINSLNPGTSYDVYVYTDCGAFGFSDTIGPVNFSTLSVPAAQLQGPAMALDFDGSNDWVNVSNGKVSAASLGLPASAITVESWVYARDYSTWHSVIGFLQDNGNTESGWDLEVRDDNRFCFALSTGGALNYMETNTQFATGRWYHLAGTYDGTTQKLYVNGHLEASAPMTGSINYLDSWLAIGAYKDDNEQYSFDGLIDEVRIWNTAHTQEEIRDLMCEKLIGNEAGLVAYFRLDEQDGLTAADASGHLADGTLTGMTTADHVISGAALGDDSEHVHDAADWTTTEVQLGSATNGSVAAHVLSGSPHGIHLYRINSIPDSLPQLPFVNGASNYYGVFVSEANQSVFANYTVEWDYNGFNDAVLVENDLALAVRSDNTALYWALNEANVQLVPNLVSSDTLGAHKQFILVRKDGINCTLPSGLGLGFQETDSVGGIWTNGSSGSATVQWGPVGFPLGSGTIASEITNESFTFEPLAQDMMYEFYVLDSCAGENAPWVGPYVFTGDRCMEPTGIAVSDVTFSTATIGWNSTNGNSWIISWGAPGFLVDWGIQTTAPATTHTLTSLAPETTYEFYVRSVCSSGNSIWVGPFQFTTAINTTGLSEQASYAQFFPNPSNGLINIVSGSPIIAVAITGIDGSQIEYSGVVNPMDATLELNNAAPGIYLVTIQTSAGTQQERLIIQ